MNQLWFILVLFPISVMGQSATSTDSLLNNQCDTIYRFVENMPQFPGGDVELLRRVSGFLDVKSCPHRKSSLNYVIDSNGRPVNLKVNGISDNCTRHFIEEFEKLPDWTPGFHGGTPVCVEFSIPLIIELK